MIYLVLPGIGVQVDGVKGLGGGELDAHPGEALGCETICRTVGGKH
jgi:hypothetical protein